MTSAIRNLLSLEKSPYLLQHKDNPVHWQPWGEAAFERAKAEDKLVFLSIGYSTCYWCHVMEKDSFETEEVAKVLNKDFICIKVDREERPDIDRIYMDAVVALSGHGGWPMSVFLTPEKKPVFGGTFFYKPQFIRLLEQLNHLWREQRDSVFRTAEQITDYLQRASDLGGALETDAELKNELFEDALSELEQSYDSIDGGFGGAPKFPPSERLSLLLRIHRRLKKDNALEMTKSTLQHMARGGIFDHLEGGFHRYATDAKWLVPHFEKMLYDNALLAWTYLEAFQVTRDQTFESVARETLDYVLRRMTDKTGGFYSAEDAGEVGKEGEFYVWKWEELQAALSEEELTALSQVYTISLPGNFEHETNILSLHPGATWQIRTSSVVQQASEKLRELRNKRQRPHLDDKILTSWNGLMIASFAKGYQVLRDSRYLKSAQAAAAFIREKLFVDGTLLHRYRDGDARFTGTLDDYAYLIHGLLALYEADFDSQWLLWANELQQVQDELFLDRRDGGYFFTVQDDPTVLVRRKDFGDEAVPSGNGIAALNLLKLYGFFADSEYRLQVEALFQRASTLLSRAPSAFAALMVALDYHLDSSVEVAVIGTSDNSDMHELQEFIGLEFLPNKVVAFAQAGDKRPENEIALLNNRTSSKGTFEVHVCKDQVCDLPKSDLGQIKAALSNIGHAKS